MVVERMGPSGAHVRETQWRNVATVIPRTQWSAQKGGREQEENREIESSSTEIQRPFVCTLTIRSRGHVARMTGNHNVLFGRHLDIASGGGLYKYRDRSSM